MTRRKHPVPSSPAPLPSPDAAPAPSPAPPPRSRLRRILSVSARILLVLFAALFLLLAALFAYLHFAGLPPSISDAILDRLAAQGIHLAVSRIALDFPLGLSASDVRFYPSADAPSPFIEAPAVSVSLSPRALLRDPSSPAGSVSVSGASIRARPNSPLLARRASAASDELVISSIAFRMSFSPSRLVLRDASLDLLGIRIHARGTCDLDPSPAPSDPSRDPLAEFFDLLDHPSPALLSAIDNFNATSFRDAPSADISFAIDLADLPAARAALHFRNPAGGAWRDFAFSSSEAFLSFSNSAVSIPRFQLASGPRSLSCSASFSFADSNLLLHASSTLSPDDVLPLLPPDLRTRVAQFVPDPDFPLSLSLDAGPAPLPVALENFSASLSLRSARIAEVPVEALSLSLLRAGSTFSVSNASIAVSNGPSATALSIPSASFDLDSLRLLVSLRGPLNPAHFAHLLPDYVSEPISWLDFPAAPPSVDVSVVVPFDNPLSASAVGFGYATNFVFQGVPLDSARSRVAFSNEVLHLSAIKVARPEGIASGDVHVAFSNETIRLNVDSSLEPRASFALLGPFVTDFFAPFRFDGPVRAHAEGVIDYSSLALNQVQAHIDACRAGYSNWVADSVSADLRVRGRRVSFTNIVASLYGGDLRADVSFFPVGVDENWRFELNLRSLDNFRLESFFDDTFGDSLEDAPRGFLSASGRLAGYFGGESPLSSLSGSGSASIRDGFLFQAGLFSGLSDLVSYVLPGFSLFAQTEAAGSFEIADGRLSTHDLQVQGSVFSVGVDGSYGFDNSLDFVFELKLLRSGPVAYLVRLATLPVTHLLEFRLSGSLDEPSWRPATLSPSAFFSLFSRDAPDAQK